MMQEIHIDDDIIREKFLKELEKTKKYCKKQKKVLEDLFKNEHEIQIILMIKPIGENDGEHQ